MGLVVFGMVWDVFGMLCSVVVGMIWGWSLYDFGCVLVWVG